MDKFIGVVGPGGTLWRASRSELESRTREGDSPVGESTKQRAGDPEYHGAR